MSLNDDCAGTALHRSAALNGLAGRSRRRSKVLIAGFTLIEVMIAVTVMAIMIAGAASTLSTTWRHNQLMREEAAALRGAERMLAVIRTYSCEEIVSTFSTNDTFRVDVLPVQPRTMGLSMSSVPQDEGEVVLLLDETPNEFDYGNVMDGDTDLDRVDLDGNGTIGTTLADGSLLMQDVDGNGSADGIDLDGDGDVDGDRAYFLANPGELKLLPVVVLVRWRSFARGIRGRVQLMTVVGSP